MVPVDTPCLHDCIARYRDTIPALADVACHLPPGDDNHAVQSLLRIYEQIYPLLEKALWQEEVEFETLLHSYQSLFREQQMLEQRLPEDEHHDFILSIPVADRPSHLHACLESIYQICKQFGYGGMSVGPDNTRQYAKIRIIVAEDSREEKNIHRHLELIDKYRGKGLQIVHFGQHEQYEMLQSLPQRQRQALGKLLTTQPKDRFYLKGQAANRNLSYLKCLQLTRNRAKTLYYFVDSDQNFCVNRQTGSGEQTVYALNYFYYIDRLFRTTRTSLLTGKLVGDPPVSPSVMAANFLDDVIGFFTRLAQTGKHTSCQFHTELKDPIGDAAYHDMAGLFGFQQQHTHYPYRCKLAGAHDHAACLAGFSSRLNAFFFGEHLTRKTTFDYGNGFTEISPARTIYPGNYIVNQDGLRYIIPFGHLRLRMSGPTAGRLIAAEIHERFATINLPHLHRRTTEAGLADDFRPGVEREDNSVQERIDLSNEFERQFFGDLMLFTTEALVRQVDVRKPFEKVRISSLLDEKETELLALYQQKHLAIVEKSRQLEALVFEAGHWWQDVAELKQAREQVRTFIDNVQHNFGDQSLAWQQIRSQTHRNTRKRQITDALLNYREERNAWDQLFA